MHFQQKILWALVLFLSCDSRIPSTKSKPELTFKNEKLKINPLKDGRKLPLIAVIGSNLGTETTDYIIPLSIFRSSNIADVIALSTTDRILSMMPALKIKTDQVIYDFDQNHPMGADIVIVPAVHNPEDPILLKWIKEQNDKKAIVVSICEGARVLANAGLLDEQVATTHWYAIEDLKKRFTKTKWFQTSRYIQSNNIISTSGVTASIPVTLAIIEAITGKKISDELYKKLNLKDYSSFHEGTKFQLDWAYRFLVVRNFLSFWGHEKIGIKISNGVDELSLALVSDAYSRTFRSQAVTQSDSAEVKTNGGLTILPDYPLATKSDFEIPPQILEQGSESLPAILLSIKERYSALTAAFVALQLEFPSES